MMPRFDLFAVKCHSLWWETFVWICPCLQVDTFTNIEKHPLGTWTKSASKNGREGSTELSKARPEAFSPAMTESKIRLWLCLRIICVYTYDTGLSHAREFLTSCRASAANGSANFEKWYCWNNITAGALRWVPEPKTNGSIKQNMDRSQSWLLLRHIPEHGMLLGVSAITCHPCGCSSVSF